MKRDRNRRRSRRALPEYADVDVELTLMTFRKLAPTVLVGSAGVIIATGLVAQRSYDLRLWNFAFLMAAICSIRLGIVVAFGLLPRTEMTLAEARRWLQWYGTSTLLHCLCICIATIYNFRSHNELASSLCTIGTFSQCAGLTARAGMRPWFKNTCCFTLLAALAFSIVSTQVVLATTCGVMIAFFAYAQSAAINNQFDIVVEQLRSRRKLRELAEQDTLTGLANRRHFQTELLTACSQPNHPFAILYIDLDKFKAVNDTFGHPTGDQLLNLVASRLRKAVRGSDLVARLGGDEFAILQRAVVSRQDAMALASRVVADLSAAFNIGGNPIQIGASVGIRLSSEVDRDPSLLLAHADIALYRAKQAGGSNFSFPEL